MNGHRNQYINAVNLLRLEAESLQRDLSLSPKEAMHLAQELNPGYTRITQEDMIHV